MKSNFYHSLDSISSNKPHDLSILYSTKVNLDSPMAVKNSIDGQALNVYLGKSKIRAKYNVESKIVPIFVYTY